MTSAEAWGLVTSIWAIVGIFTFFYSLDQGGKAYGEDPFTVLCVRAPIRSIFWPVFFLIAVISRIPGEFQRARKDGW